MRSYGARARTQRARKLGQGCRAWWLSAIRTGLGICALSLRTAFADCIILRNVGGPFLADRWADAQNESVRGAAALRGLTARAAYKEGASAGIRTRVKSAATLYSTTRPLMLLILWSAFAGNGADTSALPYLLRPCVYVGEDLNAQE